LIASFHAAVFASGCKSAGHPVKSVTIGATKKGGAQRVSAGAAGVVVFGLMTMSLML
jgi:hypothetical protein